VKRPIKKSVPKRKGYAEGGQVSAPPKKDDDMESYNDYLQYRARQNALQGREATPFSDEGKARGGKVRKVIRRGK
jgi:hypothetical protein